MTDGYPLTVEACAATGHCRYCVLSDEPRCCACGSLPTNDGAPIDYAAIEAEARARGVYGPGPEELR